MCSLADYVARRIVQAQRDNLRRTRRSASPDDVYAAVLAALGSDGAFVFGHLRGGTEVRIPCALLWRVCILEGASGSGKSYSVTHLATQDAVLEHDLVIHDFKSESAVLVAAAIAQKAKRNPRLRDALIGRCLVCQMTETHVTPIAPFRAIPGISPEYLAELRAAMFTAVSSDPLSGGMREVATNLFELACLFDTPYSEAFFEAVLTASDYRSRLAEDVASPPLRAFLADLERRYPPQTLAAIARRLRAFSRNRLIRARYGLTGKELDRHGLPVAPKVRLEHHSPSLSVPMSIAAATALWSLIDLLLMIARRPRTAPGLLCVVEELSALLSATGNDPVLISLLLHVIRTARVTHAGLFLVSQGFATLDRTLHDELLLNAAAWVTFQSPSTGFADVIGAHLVAPRPPSAALVRRTLATLPPREAVLTVKGVGAVPFRTAELALPTGEALDRLAESFVRDFAPSSTLPITVIEDSLARFEQEFVFNRVRPSAKKARARELLGLGGDA